MSYTDFLRSRGASPEAIARMSVFGIWGDGLETVSALMVLRDDAFFESAKNDFHIRGGNDLLPRAFADRLKEKILYGSPASESMTRAVFGSSFSSELNITHWPATSSLSRFLSPCCDGWIYSLASHQKNKR
jgi:hypothetical protein